MRITPRVLVGHSFGGKGSFAILLHHSMLTSAWFLLVMLKSKDLISQIKEQKFLSLQYLYELCSLEECVHVQSFILANLCCFYCHHIIVWVLNYTVALSMVDQAAKPLARPVKVPIIFYHWFQYESNKTCDLWNQYLQNSFIWKVWCLDATPGKLRPGGHGEDRPGELITFLSRMPEQV